MFNQIESASLLALFQPLTHQQTLYSAVTLLTDLVPAVFIKHFSDKYSMFKKQNKKLSFICFCISKKKKHLEFQNHSLPSWWLFLILRTWDFQNCRTWCPIVVKYKSSKSLILLPHSSLLVASELVCTFLTLVYFLFQVK